jgi:hypothetical protein
MQNGSANRIIWNLMASKDGSLRILDLRNEAGGKLSFIARLMAGTKNPQLDIFAFTQAMRGWGQDFGIAKRGDSER